MEIDLMASQQILEKQLKKVTSITKPFKFSKILESNQFYNMSATLEWHECDSNDTSKTQATRELHERHESKMREIF